MDMLERIRIAQRDVAENIVIASLEKAGLTAKEPTPVPPKQENGLPDGVEFSALDFEQWLHEGMNRQIESGYASDGMKAARRGFERAKTAEVIHLANHFTERLARILTRYEREEAASALCIIADVFGLGSAVRDPATVVSKVREMARELEQYKVAYAESLAVELARLSHDGKVAP